MGPDSRLRKIDFNRAAPWTLLWACLLAFGLTIPWLGLYADDWPFVYVNHLAGLRGVVDFISWVRPVAAWFFAATAALGSTHFWVYHVLLLILRWLDAVLLWLVLRRIWPQIEDPAAGPAARPALWAALLFAIYPAFKQQPLALEYTPHFVALALLFGSFWINLRLLQGPALPKAQAAVLGGLAWLGAFQVFILEYFTGLELLRPVLVWLALSRCMTPAKAARKTLRLWLPYLPVLAGFLVWRVFVLRFPSYQPELVNHLSAAPLSAAVELVKTVLRDLWTAGIAAWIQPFRLPGLGRAALAQLAVILFAFLTLGLLVLRSSAKKDLPAESDRPADGFSAISRRWPLEAVLLGLFGLLVAGGPFWVTGIPLTLDFPWDRPSLAFMPGACLLAAGLVGLAGRALERIRPRLGWAAPLVIVLLAAFSIGLHFQNANAFRREWDLMTSFFWQLTWRAPALQPGTALLLDQTPFNYHVDKFLSPLVNWTYAPENRDLRSPYALLDFYKHWGRTLPPKTTADPLSTGYGTLSFNSDTSHLLVIVYAPPGCLRVLTPADRARLPMSDDLKEALPLTNLALINPAPAEPALLPEFLGDMPDQNWCYFFEKAELYTRSGDPLGAIDLLDQIQTAGVSPRQPTEFLTFVDAYTKLGRWQEALELSQKVAGTGDSARRAACAAWEDVSDQSQAAHARAVLKCK